MSDSLHGKGTMAIALAAVMMIGFGLTSAGALPYSLPDVVSPPMEATLLEAPALQESGHHVVAHFWVEQRGVASDTAVAQLVTSTGDELMHAYVSQGDLFASNGWANEVDNEPAYTAVGSLELQTHRLDLWLQGNSYTLRLDGNTPVTLSTFSHGTEAQWGNVEDVQDQLPFQGEPWGLERLRFYDDDAMHTSFVESDPAPNGWQLHDPHGLLLVETDRWGHMGEGRLMVDASRLDASKRLGYLFADLEGVGGAYVAEADFRPRDTNPMAFNGVPDHQAVLAGLSGALDEPVVNWALVMSPFPYTPEPAWVEDPDGAIQAGVTEHCLCMLDPQAGTRTVVATWKLGDPAWSSVRAFVDEDAKTITVQVDDAEQAHLFTFDELGASDQVAIGDVFKDHLWWTGGGLGYYDNVAVAPWETQQ